MGDVPRDGGIDSSLSFLREGYRFIPNRARRLGSDIFETRLMGQPVVCITGPEAAEAFYAPGRMTRRKALPPTTLTLLQDKGSVALKNGAEHRHRKEMFLGLTRPGRFDALVEACAAEWSAAADLWERRSAVVLHPVAQEILCRAVCSWAGVPLREDEVPDRTEELATMIDGAGAIGPRQWRGQLLRQRGERWVRGIVDGFRHGGGQLPEGSPAAVIAAHRDPNGELLDTRVAAVEIINLLRPTVAVARFVVFAALALHEHPEARAYVEEGGADEREHFVNEVRRHYPFFPVVGGRVAEPFEWRGRRFDEGEWVMLDIYGTNRDARAWNEPERFRPERFRDWEGDPYSLIPQGGGDHATNHRCPGEWITIELLKVAVEFLTERIDYDVPPQDLAVDMSRLPAIPASGFVIENVRVRERVAA